MTNHNHFMLNDRQICFPSGWPMWPEKVKISCFTLQKVRKNWDLVREKSGKGQKISSLTTCGNPVTVKLWRGWVIMPNGFMWMGLLTHILQETPVESIHASKVAVTIVKSVKQTKIVFYSFYVYLFNMTRDMGFVQCRLKLLLELAQLHNM